MKNVWQQVGGGYRARLMDIRLDDDLPLEKILIRMNGNFPVVNRIRWRIRQHISFKGIAILR